MAIAGGRGLVLGRGPRLLCAAIPRLWRCPANPRAPPAMARQGPGRPTRDHWPGAGGVSDGGRAAPQLPGPGRPQRDGAGPPPVRGAGRGRGGHRRARRGLPPPGHRPGGHRHRGVAERHRCLGLRPEVPRPGPPGAAVRRGAADGRAAGHGAGAAHGGDRGRSGAQQVGCCCRLAAWLSVVCSRVLGGRSCQSAGAVQTLGISGVPPGQAFAFKVLDTLPPGGGGGGQRVGGWVKGLFQWFLGGMDPIPPGVGVGFSWVVGVRALGLRGTEHLDILFTQ